MAAFPIARMFDPRVLPFVAAAATSRLAPRAATFLPAERISMRRKMDLSTAAATVLIAGSEALLAVWLLAAVAVGLYGITGAAL